MSGARKTMELDGMTWFSTEKLQFDVYELLNMMNNLL